MILDLLTNPSLMKTNNLAKGYDVLTGNVDDNVMEKFTLEMSGSQQEINFVVLRMIFTITCQLH
jgi:hypothetical protein